jgi:hypothetical protein
VTDAADRTYDMLQRIGEFLKKLTPEKYDALLSGEARLEVVAKGAKISTPGASRTAAPVALPISAEKVAADLAKFDDRGSAEQYLADLKLKRPQLVSLAKELDVAFKTSETMPVIRGLIVSQIVGARLTTNAILESRPAR